MTAQGLRGPPALSFMSGSRWGVAGVSWCGDLQEKDFTMLRDNGKPPGTTPPSHTTPATVQLTVKERQVLEWVAIGKSAWEISRIQGCTEATVHFYT
ncbi:Regulatory protein LuxR, partial [Pseudomonas savastanoi]